MKKGRNSVKKYMIGIFRITVQYNTHPEDKKN
jgi:hypothetical protein